MDGVKSSNLFTIASKRIFKKTSERNLTEQLKELYTEKGTIFKKEIDEGTNKATGFGSQ